MRPILFEISASWLSAPLQIHSYGMMLGMSFVLGVYLYLYLLQRHRLATRHVYVAISLAILGALAGARILFILANMKEDWNLARMVAPNGGGLVAYGGYIGGILCGAGYLLARKENVLAHVDACTPTLVLGLSLTRIGCFLNGCCFGARTDGPSGVSFPAGSLAFSQHTHRGWPLLDQYHTVPIHPTQLYECGFGLLLLVVVGLLLRSQRKERLADRSAIESGAPRERRKLADGLVFITFVGAYALWRFLIEFLRDDANRGSLAALSTSQIISMVLVAGCAVLFGRRRAGAW